MNIWNKYPPTYREKAVQRILSAAQAGECALVLGLSGAGKSNLLGFIANREDIVSQPTVLVDCNRLFESTPDAFFQLILNSMGEAEQGMIAYRAVNEAIQRRLSEATNSFTILLDRFEALDDPLVAAISGGLRSLRDAHKYQLSYVIASRNPLDPFDELAELFYANTFWLGPLSESDARWNVNRYAKRKNLQWGDDIADEMIRLTGGYPSLLKAICEAYAQVADFDAVVDHVAVRRRVDEFWSDAPSEAALRDSGLAGLPLLMADRAPKEIDLSQLTAKEHLLLEYLRAHVDQVCEKDALISAVWPEDEIYERGIRDDSLSQLVRRLRVKIEPDPSEPTFIITIPGRGYRFVEQLSQL